MSCAVDACEAGGMRRVGHSVVYCALLVPKAFGQFRSPGRALISLLLGLVALVPLALEVNSVARGVLYGIVDRGPYDNAWGGPSRAGAWIVHLLISIPVAGVG